MSPNEVSFHRRSILRNLEKDCQQHQIRHRGAVIFGPVLILALLALLLWLPASNRFGQWLLDENRPVELLTFAIALWAAFKGFKLVQKQSRKRNRLGMLFYLLFALFFFFFAMEEISWGQQLLGFSTPEFWRVRNAQDELTLHNYDFAGAVYLEAYPFAAGVIGLIGVWASWMNKLPDTISPPLILFPWFAAIALHSGIDLFHEFYIFSPAFDELINHLDEAAEMMVAIAGLLYVHFKARRLSH